MSHVPAPAAPDAKEPAPAAPKPPGERRPRRWPQVLGCLIFALVGAMIVIPSYLEATRPENTSWIADFRTLTTAQALFREGDKEKDRVLDYATSLRELGEVGLIDPTFASGTKQGYRFRIIAADQFTWSASADPIEPEWGYRWGYVDESHKIRFSTTGPATVTDRGLGE